MPDVTQAFGLFWATVFGAAIGVAAGTVIQYFLTKLLERQSKARQKIILVKELTYNRSLVDELVAQVTRLRNAINGGVFDRYSGFFPYNNAILTQINAATNSGALYEFLSTEEVRRVQRIGSVLSISNASWVNAEVTKFKDTFINGPQNFDLHGAINFVDYIENQIREVGQWIDGLITTLST